MTEQAAAEPKRVRKPRSDGIQNASRVTAAAAAVFSRRGTSLTLQDVAHEAGVSRATVYNVYRDRDHLVEDMVFDYYSRMVDEIRGSSPDESAWDVLSRSVLVSNIGAAAGYWIDQERQSPRVIAILEQADSCLEELFARGRTRGEIRADVTVHEFLTLFRGLFLALPEYSIDRTTEVARYSQIILRGIRADPHQG